MAITIDWPSGVISVPQSDLTLVSGALYDFDTEAFREALIALEDDVEGMPWPRTHIHNTSVTVAGVTYARFIEIISPYSVTFEDTGSAYAIRFVGSNNNIFDVENGILNPTDKVSYIPTNSAGLIIAETGTSGLTPTESQALLDIDTNVDALIVDTAANSAKLDILLASQNLTAAQMAAQRLTDPNTGKLVLRNWATVERWEADIWQDLDRTIPYQGNGLEVADQLVQVDWPYTVLVMTNDGIYHGTEQPSGRVIPDWSVEHSDLSTLIDGDNDTWINFKAIGFNDYSLVDGSYAAFTPDTFINHKWYIRIRGGVNDEWGDPIPVDGPNTLYSEVYLFENAGTSPSAQVPAHADTGDWVDFLIDVPEAEAALIAANGSWFEAGIFHWPSTVLTTEYDISRIEYRVPNMATDLWP